MAKNIFSVCTLILNQEGLALLVSRKNNPNDFGLPGGKIDPGEGPIEAAIRETLEETGVKVTSNHLIPVYVGPDAPGSEKLCVTYWVSKYNDESLGTTESGIVKWAPFAETLSGTFADYNSRLLTQLMKRIR